MFAFVRQLERFVCALGIDTARMLRIYLREMRRALEQPIMLAMCTGLSMFSTRVFAQHGKLTTPQEVVQAGVHKVAELLRRCMDTNKPGRGNCGGGGGGGSGSSGGAGVRNEEEVYAQCVLDATALIDMLNSEVSGE